MVFTTTKFDRFARNMVEAGEIPTDLRKREVLFSLGSPIYDWHDPFGKLNHRRYHDPDDDASLADSAEECSVGRSTIYRIVSGTAPRTSPARYRSTSPSPLVQPYVLFSRDYYRNSLPRPRQGFVNGYPESCPCCRRTSQGENTVKTAIATAMIAGFALVGVGAAGAASAESQFPVKTGLSTFNSCYSWVLENAKAGHQYDCVQAQDGTWTAIWRVP